MATYVFRCPRCAWRWESAQPDPDAEFFLCCGDNPIRDYKAENVNVNTSNLRKARG